MQVDSFPTQVVKAHKATTMRATKQRRRFTFCSNFAYLASEWEQDLYNIFKRRWSKVVQIYIVSAFLPSVKQHFLEERWLKLIVNYRMHLYDKITVVWLDCCFSEKVFASDCCYYFFDNYFVLSKKINVKRLTESSLCLWKRISQHK